MPLLNASERIFDAAERGDLELLRQCLAAGVAVDIPDKRKSPNGVPTQLTPLHWACRQGQSAAASALLDAGASVTYATHGSNSHVGGVASIAHVPISDFSSC